MKILFRAFLVGIYFYSIASYGIEEFIPISSPILPESIDRLCNGEYKNVCECRIKVGFKLIDNDEHKGIILMIQDILLINSNKITKSEIEKQLVERLGQEYLNNVKTGVKEYGDSIDKEAKKICLAL